MGVEEGKHAVAARARARMGSAGPGRPPKKRYHHLFDLTLNNPLALSPHSPRKAPTPYATEVAAYEAETAARKAHPLPRLPTTPRAHPTHPPSPLLAWVPGAVPAAAPSPRRRRTSAPAGAGCAAAWPAAGGGADARAAVITSGWPCLATTAPLLRPGGGCTAGGAGCGEGDDDDAAAAAAAAASELEDETDVSSFPGSPLARAAAAAFGGGGGGRVPGLNNNRCPPAAAAAAAAVPPSIDWGLAGPAIAAGSVFPAIARRLSTAALLFEDGGGGEAAAAWAGEEAGLLHAGPALAAPHRPHHHPLPSSLAPLPPVGGAFFPPAAHWAAAPPSIDPRNLSLDSTATVFAGGDVGVRAYLRAGAGAGEAAPAAAATAPAAWAVAATTSSTPRRPSAAVLDAAAALGMGSVTVPPEELRARLEELEAWVEGMAPGILTGTGS